jgi:putative (di)nucleoside polyphosphate hydrolase
MTRSTEQSAPSLYRPCVGIMLLNSAGLVWIGKRSEPGGTENATSEYAWQMPQGGIDRGEEPLAAAKRELFEETGVRGARLLAEAPDWFSYDLPPMIGRKSWKGRYRGQTQKWFAFRFEGRDEDIDLTKTIGPNHKPEFSDWRWEHMHRLAELVIPFKRPVYEKVVASFAHLGIRPA